MARTKQKVRETRGGEGEGENGRTGEPATKMEAVKRALDTLGWKSKPADIQKHVREEYGLEMSAKMASVYKSKLTSRMGKRGRRGRKPKAEGAEVAAPPKAAPGGEVSFKDLRVLKEMRTRLGHPRLRELFELMAQ